MRYQPGDVVRFHQQARGGFIKGEAAVVVGLNDSGEVMVKREMDKKAKSLPLDQSRHFDVYERRDLPLAAGDRIRITQNGSAAGGKGRLMNGSLHSVASFDARGNIVLDNGQIVSRDYGHLAHGYCTTSHSSQGKTVDRVLLAMGPQSFAAASKEQFYVSVSRARESVTVYCEDKRELLEAVGRSSARMSATELAAQSNPPENRPQSRVVRLVEHIRRVARATIGRERSQKRDNVRGRDTVREWNKNLGLER
jgi:ATP-dependent exoDNAse (exonuclease V) alpha subunit